MTIMLSLWQQAQMGFRGYAYTQHRKREGWKGALPFYVVMCPVHGPYEEYPHGFRRRLMCPKCDHVIFLGAEE